MESLRHEQSVKWIAMDMRQIGDRPCMIRSDGKKFSF